MDIIWWVGAAHIAFYAVCGLIVAGALITEQVLRYAGVWPLFWKFAVQHYKDKAARKRGDA